MISRNTLACAAAIGLIVMSAGVRPAAQTHATTPSVSTPAVSNAGSVVGSAWNADNSGIPGARLRLRNVSTGKIAASVIADQLGQFRFDAAPGSYLIELVDESTKLLAVGQVFTINQGETVATFVRLGTKLPWIAGFFSNAAAAAITAAAAEGVTALAPVARPVSRKQ